MAKTKLQEWLEQWLGHFLLLGIIAASIHPAIAIAIMYVRELTSLKLPWVFKGQWPPGKPKWIYEIDTGPDGYPVGTQKKVWVTQMDRVEDLRSDLQHTLAGIVVGIVIHIWVVAGLTGGIHWWPF